MKNKVYITSLHMKHGGIEMAITLLANALVNRGYEVEILNTYRIGEPAYELDDRVQVTYLTDVQPNREAFQAAVQCKNPAKMLKEGLYAVKVLYLKKKTMKEKIKEIQSGVILATRNDHAVLLSRYGNSGVHKIAQLHHDHQFEKGILKDFRENYGNIDEFVVLTDQLQQEIKEIMKDNHHTKVLVIPNFLPKVECKASGVRKKQMIAVGRLHEVKGFLRLIDLWNTFSKETDVCLKIIGDGEQHQRLKEKIQTLGLEGKVILTGAMDHSQVMEEMSQSLAYVMTSFTEAFPYVLLEAMSAGLPVIAFDVRVGPRAIITDGKDGFLVEDGNETMFIEKLRILLESDNLREEMSRKAVEKVQRFSEEEVLKLWEPLLDQTEV